LIFQLFSLSSREEYKGNMWKQENGTVQNSIPGRTMQFAPALKLFVGAILVIALREPA